MTKKIFYLFILTCALLIFWPSTVKADLGPKPTARFEISIDGEKIPDAQFEGEMLSCVSKDGNKELFSDGDYYNKKDHHTSKLNINQFDSEKNCHWRPVKLAWGGDCENSSCSFSYILPDPFKLAVYLPSLDKVFISDEISRDNFNSHYKVNLQSGGSAEIYENTPFWSTSQFFSFAKALLITLLLEIFITLIYLSKSKFKRRITVLVLIANIISLPIVWFLAPLIGLPNTLIVIIYEVFAIVFEAYFIYLLAKKVLSLKKSFTLSILNNLISLILGGVIYWFIGFVI